LDYAAGRDNPNAIYKEGRDAAERLSDVRKKIAGIISSAEDEVFLTTCGTEANASLRSLLRPGDHVVISSIEHESLLGLFQELEDGDVEVTYVAPSKEGIVSATDVGKAIRKNTKLVSIMYANNEIGTIQPIKDIARILRRNRLSVLAPSEPREAGQSWRSEQTISSRVVFHSDCVQAPGLLPINVQSLGVDMASFSAPKFDGPAGAGFMYKRRWVKCRVPKENVAIGLAEKMCQTLVVAEERRDKEVIRLTKLRDYFIDQILTWGSDPQVRLNGSREFRLANNANFVFPIESELMVIELDKAGTAVSGGAACSAGGCKEESHVILALGKSKQDAQNSVRFSLGADTKKSDIDYVLKLLPKIINKHKNIWPSPKKQ